MFLHQTPEMIPFHEMSPRERQGVYAGKLATLEAKMDRVFAALEFTEPHD